MFMGTTTSRKERTPASCGRSGEPSGQRGVDALAGLDQGMDRGDRLLEHRLLGLVERDLDDPFDAIGADNRRHADISVLDAVLAGQMRCDRQNAALVLEI